MTGDWTATDWNFVVTLVGLVGSLVGLWSYFMSRYERRRHWRWAAASLAIFAGSFTWRAFCLHWLKEYGYRTLVADLPISVGGGLAAAQAGISVGAILVAAAVLARYQRSVHGQSDSAQTPIRQRLPLFSLRWFGWAVAVAISTLGILVTYTLSGKLRDARLAACPLPEAHGAAYHDQIAAAAVNEVGGDVVGVIADLESALRRVEADTTEIQSGLDAVFTLLADAGYRPALRGGGEATEREKPDGPR